MIKLRNDCKELLLHIKKCKIAMELDGYIYAGLIGYILRMPFKKIHKYQFSKINIYINEINAYIKKNNINLDLKEFEELENISIIYSPQQVSILGYKDYKHRLKYLENLEATVTNLLTSIDNNILKDK